MRRRTFLKNTALTSAGMAMMGYGYGMGRNFSSSINVGVIGTGDRGTGLIASMNGIEGLNVTACCDIIPFRLENAVSLTNNPKVKGFSDYKKMLADKDVDAVIIATPFSMHAQMAIDALDAGKHVFCEKTLTKGVEDTKRLVSKARSSNLIFQTGHQYHSSKMYRYAVEQIAAGKVGKIAAIECQWNRNGDWRRKSPDPKWEKMINWRMYREYSGGLIAELCSHQMDFCNWILRDTPTRIMGAGGIDYWKDGRETFDNTHVLAEYSKGVKAKFTCLTSNSKGDYKITVLGDKGTMILGYSNAWFFPENFQPKEIGTVDGVSGATAKWDEEKGFLLPVEDNDASATALIDFQQSIIDGKQPESNIYTGAKVSFMVDMALRAVHNKEIVTWEKEYDAYLS